MPTEPTVVDIDYVVVAPNLLEQSEPSPNVFWEIVRRNSGYPEQVLRAWWKVERTWRDSSYATLGSGIGSHPKSTKIDDAMAELATISDMNKVDSFDFNRKILDLRCNWRQFVKIK